MSRIKGLGKKTAERIVLELKDKVGVTEAWQVAGQEEASPEATAANDAVLGLIALGYKQVEAQKAVKKVADEGGSADDLIRGALRLLSRS